MRNGRSGPLCQRRGGRAVMGTLLLLLCPPPGCMVWGWGGLLFPISLLGLVGAAPHPSAASVLPQHPPLVHHLSFCSITFLQHPSPLHNPSLHSTHTSPAPFCSTHPSASPFCSTHPLCTTHPCTAPLHLQHPSASPNCMTEPCAAPILFQHPPAAPIPVQHPSAAPIPRSFPSTHPAAPTLPHSTVPTELHFLPSSQPRQHKVHSIGNPKPPALMGPSPHTSPLRSLQSNRSAGLPESGSGTLDTVRSPPRSHPYHSPHSK